jgi:hypothetical protein
MPQLTLLTRDTYTYGGINCDDNNEDNADSSNQINNNKDSVNINNSIDNFSTSANTNKKRKKIIALSAIAASVALLAAALWIGVFSNAFGSGDNSLAASASVPGNSDNNSTLPATDDTEPVPDPPETEPLPEDDQTDNASDKNNSSKDPSPNNPSPNNPSPDNPPKETPPPDNIITVSEISGGWTNSSEFILFSSGTYVLHLGPDPEGTPGTYSLTNNKLTLNPVGGSSVTYDIKLSTNGKELTIVGRGTYWRPPSIPTA